MASRTSAASAALASGRTNARPSRRAQSTIASALRIARFLDFGFRQSDEIERRQSVAEMHLEGDERRVEAREAARHDDGE
jgi:hypothetical protein